MEMMMVMMITVVAVVVGCCCRHNCQCWRLRASRVQCSTRRNKKGNSFVEWMDEEMIRRLLLMAMTAAAAAEGGGEGDDVFVSLHAKWPRWGRCCCCLQSPLPLVVSIKTILIQAPLPWWRRTSTPQVDDEDEDETQRRSWIGQHSW